MLLALLLFALARERRMVALTNLSLCFPDSSVAQRIRWALAHIYFYLRTFLDRAWLWSGDEKVVRDRVRIENPEALAILDESRPTIFLAPHFLGLDAAWSRLCLEINMVTMYSNQKKPGIEFTHTARPIQIWRSTAFIPPAGGTSTAGCDEKRPAIVLFARHGFW